MDISVALVDVPADHGAPPRDVPADTRPDAPPDAGADSQTDARMNVPVDVPLDAPLAMDTPTTRDAPAPTDMPVTRDVSVARDISVAMDIPFVTDVPAAPDGGPGDPLAALETCLGASAPLTIAGQMPYSDVAVGTTHGAFVVDYGSTFSSIDLGAFPSPGPATSGCDPSRLGVTCTVADFAFFAAPGSVSLVTEDFSGVSGPLRQAGILGTDFTSLRVIALGFARSQIFAAGASPCTDAALRAAGFTSLTTAGYFSNDLRTLLALSTVDAGAGGSGHVPNVPTVPVRVGGAIAVAQLDTGFNDALVPFSVNVNTAYLSAITAADPGALVRDPGRDLTLTTCVVGLSEPVEAYAIAPGRALEFIDDRGAVARRYPGATIYVKRTPPAAHRCGGIGTWTAPAAQVAASFYVDMVALVFDPYTARVWVPVR